jgi:hypothetical protein
MPVVRSMKFSSNSSGNDCAPRGTAIAHDSTTKGQARKGRHTSLWRLSVSWLERDRKQTFSFADVLQRQAKGSVSVDLSLYVTEQSRDHLFSSSRTACGS